MRFMQYMLDEVDKIYIIWQGEDGRYYLNVLDKNGTGHCAVYLD